jgi:hypothetical protein
MRWKITDVSEVLSAFIIIEIVMEAASTCEMWVHFYHTTWHNKPQKTHLHTHCEDLKLYVNKLMLIMWIMLR